MPGSPEQQLPPKEMSMFKRIVKCYEHKQYKNGLKFAKQILSQPRFAEHGETLAMKGLILNNIGKKEEAYECVKRGLKNDVRSSICWHVFGLLQRSDRKYDEAVKAYKCALRLDKENMQILRDLSLLQIQMRDMDGYRETRYVLLQLRPSQKASWIGYAMSFHLLGDYRSALNILEEFCRTQTSKKYDYEQSELLLYRASVMTEAGMLEQALTLLKENGGANGQIVDHTACNEAIGELLLRLDRHCEAADVYWHLLERNAENRAYYNGLEKAKNCQSLEERLNICLECEKKFPRATMPKKIALEFLPAGHSEFTLRLDKFLRAGLHKGVPPLFMQLQSFINCVDKSTVIDSLIRGYISSLEECGRFARDDGDVEPPTSLVWTYYFLAQHLNNLRRHVDALSVVDQELSKTPTLIELYALKGQIYRDAGNPMAAAQWLEEAQSLDTADRYINSVCARYLIQADQIDKAIAMAGKFTRENTPAADHLNEMQCMWFLTECLASYRRQGRVGEALQKCHEVERHFAEMHEDQFDFHTYSLRKMTLRSYVDMLRFEDVLRNHRFYVLAAHAAIEMYLQLHKHPLGAEGLEDDPEARNMSEGDLKKLRNKQRKAKRKAEERAEQIRQEEIRREALHRARQPERDPDSEQGPKEELLEPNKLARPADALAEATAFLRPLLQLASKDIVTHCLAYELYELKGKVLLMLRAIKAGVKLGPKHPRFYPCYVRFLFFLEKQDKAKVKRYSPVQQVLDKELPLLYPDGLSAIQLNERFLQEEGAKSLPHLFAGLVLATELDPSDNVQAKAVHHLTTNLDSNSNINGVTWDVCANIHKALLGDGRLGTTVVPGAAESFRSQCAKLFPLCSSFKTLESLQLSSAPDGLLNGSGGNESPLEKCCTKLNELMSHPPSSSFVLSEP